MTGAKRRGISHLHLLVLLELWILESGVWESGANAGSHLGVWSILRWRERGYVTLPHCRCIESPSVADGLKSAKLFRTLQGLSGGRWRTSRTAGTHGGREETSQRPRTEGENNKLDALSLDGVGKRLLVGATNLKMGSFARFLGLNDLVPTLTLSGVSGGGPSGETLPRGMCRMSDHGFNGVAMIPGDDRDKEIRIKTCITLLDKNNITNMTEHDYLAAVFKS